jgi:hypothetical protein
MTREDERTLNLVLGLAFGVVGVYYLYSGVASASEVEQ